MPDQPEKSAPTILSLGSVNADFQMRTERMPEVSETLLAYDFVRLSGGKAANVAYLARKLEVPARLFAHIGDDDLAEQTMRPLRNIGVDLNGVQKIQNASTGITMITVPPDGKKSIVMAANANLLWSPADAPALAQAIHQAPAGSVLAVDCEIPVFIVEQAMQAARAAGIKTVLDPSPADRVTDALLQLADFIVPNTGEAKELTGIDCVDVHAAIAAGRNLLARGVGNACMKLFDGGCVLVEKRHAIHILPVPLPVVDTTGAGDAFTGALAVALADGLAIEAAVRYAVAASHLAVTAYGSQQAYATREQIEQMERRLGVTTYAKHEN